jgi:hypothetical protein
LLKTNKNQKGEKGSLVGRGKREARAAGDLSSKNA